MYAKEDRLKIVYISSNLGFKTLGCKTLGKSSYGFVSSGEHTKKWVGLIY